MYREYYDFKPESATSSPSYRLAIQVFTEGLLDLSVVKKTIKFLTPERVFCFGGFLHLK